MPPPNKKQKTGSKTAETLATSLLDPKILEIRAGDNGEVFTVHRQLACSYSSYFRGLTSNAFSESLSGKMDWGEENADIVRLFVEWLYVQVIDPTGRISNIKLLDPSGVNVDSDAVFERLPTPGAELEEKITAQKLPKHSDPMEETSGDLSNNPYLILSHLWTFADKYSVPKLQNTVITAMHDLRLNKDDRAKFRLTHHIWVWENCTSKSKLRDFIVEWTCIRAAKFELFNIAGFDMPNALSNAVIRRLLYTNIDKDGRGWRHLWQEVYICRFHEHADGINCIGVALTGDANAIGG